MDFEEWEPFYHQILKKFNFSKQNDETVATYVSDYLKKSGTLSPIDNQSIHRLQEKIARKNIFVCGNAPVLKENVAACLKDLRQRTNVIIAADGATSVLLDFDIRPDIIVTDLDGKKNDDVFKEIDCANNGTLIVVHAHGDNLTQLKKYLPLIKNTSVFTATCQCRPPDGLFNFGGFTDGDRCVFLADTFGAEKVTLLGFDFDDENVTDMKKMKLDCAKQLIKELTKRNPTWIQHTCPLELNSDL